jgi:ubiquitin-like protein ATG12
MEEDPIPDEEAPEQLVTMSASVVLSSLPRDTTETLDRYSHPPAEKITVRFKAIGSAPILKQQVYRISSDQKFSVLVKFLRKQLKYKASDSLFCYINSSFSPALDELIDNLFQTFAIDDQLMVSYCNTVAFG